MKNPGHIFQMTDGRTVIVYANQPLLNELRKVVIHLVNDDHNHLLDENGKDRTILKDIGKYSQDVMAWKHMGFVD